MSLPYHVIKFLITQSTDTPTLNFSVPYPLLLSNKVLLLDLVEHELSNVDKIKITIPINHHVINMLIKVTLIEKIENSEKEFKTNVSFYDNHNRKIQELDRPNHKYAYGDSIFIIYDHNQRWNYITGSNLLLYKELVNLGAIDPSAINQIVTNKTKDILVDKLTPYLDNGLPLDSNEECKGGDHVHLPNNIVTHEGFPIDLYKYLDVNIGYSTLDRLDNLDGLDGLDSLDGLDGGNKLETIESIDYLNRVIKIMQYYPEFFAAVANQVTNQNELNTISVPLDSITTLTYPVNIKKSQYIGDIIIQNNSEPNSYSPVEQVLLTPNSTIRYLGSDVEIYPNDKLFRLEYEYNYYSSNNNNNVFIREIENFQPNNKTFKFGNNPSAQSYVKFTIYSLNEEEGVGGEGVNTPLENVSSIFMIDCNNNIVSNTVTNITTTESSIKFTYEAPPLNNTLLPYTLCIIYGNKILFNGDRTNGSYGIYIDDLNNNLNPTPAFPLIPSNEYTLSSLLYSIQNYEGSNSPSLQYNFQNITLDKNNNKSVTFTINPVIPTGLSDIFVFQFINGGYKILNINSFDLLNNSVTIYYDLLQDPNSEVAVYRPNEPIYVCFYAENNNGVGTWYYLNIDIFINATPYNPSIQANYSYPFNPTEPSQISNCDQYQLSSPLAPTIPPTTPPTIPPIDFYHPVIINTIVLFNLNVSCHTVPPEFDLSTYSFELGFLKDIEYGEGESTQVFYQLNANLLDSSTTELVMMQLYEYNMTETDPTLSYSSINAGTYSVVLGYDYDICIAIRIPSDIGGEVIYVRSNTVKFRFQNEGIDAIPHYPPLISLIEYGGDITGINFPVDGSLYTGINSYPVTQGDTVNIYIYSPIDFFESIIYINGYELSYYTKETEATNTYLGGSKSYKSPELLTNPVIVDDTVNGSIQYDYCLKISIRMTILPQKYYISVFTTTKLSQGVYSYDYSENNLYLSVIQQKNLLIQGNLINGYIVPPNINTDSTGYNDIGLYSTVNGHILLPPKSLYYYETVNLGIVLKGYFYVITGNTIENNADGVAVLDGESQHGVFCFEGQSYGKIVNTITPYSYNSIINNMLLYFKRISDLYGYGEVSKLIEAINNKLFLIDENITNVIYNIELTARNIYICGKYTTNIYINGNDLPTGISYYPNQVTWQGSSGTIPTYPNPDVVNGNPTSSGLDKYYIQYSSNGVTTAPTPLVGEYWGVYSTCDDSVQLPNNWTISNPFYLPDDTELQKFKGSNSFTTVNEIITDDPINNQINFSTKNLIIIPSDYVGYGIIDSPTAPPYILTIYLNTYISTPNPSDTCDCAQSKIQLNGSTIINGTEITIVNNSSINVRVISFNLSTQPPTPIQINLQDTTTDALFISATDNIHLIFGGDTWSII
jgi:hypothetical protein